MGSQLTWLSVRLLTGRQWVRLPHYPLSVWRFPSAEEDFCATFRVLAPIPFSARLRTTSGDDYFNPGTITLRTKFVSGLGSCS